MLAGVGIELLQRVPGAACDEQREDVVRKALVTAGLALVAAAGAPVGAAAAIDYTSARFVERTNPYAYGQAPVFMPDGNQVLFGKDFKRGQGNQVYIARFPSGSGLRCLTCTGTGSSSGNVNGVPAVRPQGDWVLFHSWRGHSFTIGSPGYGGLGSALWLMRPDGSDQTRLTGLDPAHGSGEGEDDYHAYWSPDGNHVVWAHLNWNFVDDNGQGKWDVRVADFVVSGGKPMLTHVRIVRPANGHWYETQWWAPDGSGFLYTETFGSAENPELFYCRLIDNDSACQVTRLTNDPAWDEQALFTPDMKDVIFMSSRAQPGLFNTWSQTAQTLGLPTDYDYLLILPLFEAGFLQPVGQEYTDLYELDLATRSVRRLTTDGRDGWITPEFTWDPKDEFLMWTENRFPDGYRYPLPPNATEYLQSLEELARHPPLPSLDITPSGVGVAPLPIQQRTQIAVFESPSAASTRARR
jgi:Tol biopolymer transport system component